MQMSKFQSLVYEMIRVNAPNELILVNHRPDWLYGMELDFYFPNRNFAIEVQGLQHREYVPAIQSSKEEFERQVQRDKQKQRILQRRKIKILYLHQGDPSIKSRIAGKLGKHLKLRIMKRIKGNLKAAWTGHDRLLKRFCNSNRQKAIETGAC